jgi:hypothetical protein
MKILCRHESCASHYIYTALGLELKNRGYEFIFWHPEQNSFFDIYNQIQPDIYIGQSYHITRAELKIINQNPQLKVILKVGIWGDINNELDIDNYTILIANDEEKANLDSINNKERLYLFNYHAKSYNNYILGRWTKEGYNTFSMAPVADIYNFYPDYNSNLSSDISFIGGAWGYKLLNINPYIINNFCYPVGQYNIKIFGNQYGWSIPQFNGIVSDKMVRQILSSSKIGLSVHEPQSTKFHFEALSRVFNTIACKSCVISDYVGCLYTDFFINKEILMFDNPQDYKEAVDFYLIHEDERLAYIDKLYNIVINNHTYKQRVDEILEIIE